MINQLLKCGVDLNFDALRGQLDGLKAQALLMLTATVADAAVAIGAQQSTFESTLREWIPELPDIPASTGTPMLPELLILVATKQSIQAIIEPIQRFLAQEAYNILYAEFQKKYGDAIVLAGMDLDFLISGLDSGIDPCSLVPNIVIKLDGTIGEIPKIPLYAKADPEPETPSEIAAEMVTQVKKISSDLSATESEMNSMTSAYEGVQETILGEISSFKNSMNKDSVDRSEYYKTLITKLEESSTSIESTSVPSVAKLALDNIRQGTSLT